MADLHTFWAELDTLPTGDTPLTAAEADRLSAAVLEKVHNKTTAKKAVHRAKKSRRLPLWGRALAGYDWLTQDPGGEGWLAICEDHADGTLLVDGQALYPQSGFVFEKVDDHTFAAAMDYDLADYTGSTDAMDCTLTVAGLNGTQDAHDAAGHYLQTALDGRWTLHFTASPSDTANRIGTPVEPEANGYTMTGVIAAPGETRVTVQLPAEAPDGAVLQLFTTDGQKLQCASSRPNDDGSAVTYDFDAVPAEDAALTARMVNKNTDPLTVLAQWQIALPQG